MRALRPSKIILLLLAGCATLPLDQLLPHYDGFPIKVGALLPLHPEANWGWRRIAGKMDEEGNVHLLVAPIGQMPSYLVVGKDGVLAQETVGTRPDKITKLDLAVELSGRVHALINDEHLIREPDGGDWSSAGHVPCEQMVISADTLVCAFKVDGKNVGAPAHWDILPFGGMGVGIVIPVRYQAPKLVLTSYRGDRWPAWTVIDPTLQDGVSTFTIAGDTHGFVHVAYNAYKSILLGEVLRYARVPIGSMKDAAASGDARPYRSSESLVVDPTENKSRKPIMSVDPRTGTAMLLHEFVTFSSTAVDNGHLTKAMIQSSTARAPTWKDAWSAVHVWTIVPGNDKRFYAFATRAGTLGDLQLLVWDSNKWAVSHSLSPSAVDTYEVGIAVGNGSGTVFLVTAERGDGLFSEHSIRKLVGRWIETSN